MFTFNNGAFFLKIAVWLSHFKYVVKKGIREVVKGLYQFKFISKSDTSLLK